MLQRMKQRFKNSSSSSTYSSSEGGGEGAAAEDYFDEDELEVAEILLHLPRLIVQSNIAYPPIYTWGTRRKRSALESSTPSPPPPSLITTPSLPSLPPSSSSQATHLLLPCQNKNQNQNQNGGGLVRGGGGGEAARTIKIEQSNSPKTPLSFSPSESDSKPNNNNNKRRKQQQQQLSHHHHNHHKKKTKEEWQTDVSTLTDQQETLKKELKKVMDYYETLKAKNMELKSTLHMVKNHFQQRGVVSMNSIKGNGLDLCLKSQGPTFVPSSVPEQQQHQQQVMLPMVVCHRQSPNTENSSSTRYPPYVDQMQNLGPRGIPDLNFAAAADHETTTTAATAAAAPGSIHNNTSIEYFQTSFDMNKAAVTAEARRRRIEMKKVKKSMASMKPRLQTR